MKEKRERARSKIEKQFCEIEIAYLQFVCVILKKGLENCLFECV
jgi:hypothetical protein